MSDTKRRTERITGNANPVTEDTLAELRRLVPGAFVEGKVDFDKLRAALADSVETRPERYSFSWAGKSDAICLLQVPSRATLIPVPDEGVNPDTSENLFIEGDNLEVLKLLYKPYFGRVKMIYIDPPYNTGKDFVYPDNFADPLDSYLKMTGQKDSDGNLLTSNPETSGRYHSAWLSMMYPRLFLARQLLRDDGVIFISIDDHEVHNLRIIMNEIFGEENFVASMPWKGRGGRQDSSFIAEIHEYVVVFAKNIGAFEAGEMPKEGEKFPKWDSEREKHYKTQLLRKWGSNSRRSDRPKLFYPILAPDGAEVLPKLPTGEDGCWRWDNKRMQKEMASGNVEFTLDKEGWTAYEKIYAPEEGEILMYS